MPWFKLSVAVSVLTIQRCVSMFLGMLEWAGRDVPRVFYTQLTYGMCLKALVMGKNMRIEWNQSPLEFNQITFVFCS